MSRCAKLKKFIDKRTLVAPASRGGGLYAAVIGCPSLGSLSDAHASPNVYKDRERGVPDVAKERTEEFYLCSDGRVDHPRRFGAVFRSLSASQLA